MTHEVIEDARVWMISGEIMSQLGGGHRQQRWCEYFLDSGWPVRIYCAGHWRSIVVAEAATSSRMRELRAEWIARSAPRAGVRTGAFASVGRWLKHLFLIDLALPSQFMLYRRLARDLASSEGAVALLCSSPPFALAVVCALIKVRFGVKVIFVLDMRDLWSLHAAHPGPKQHKRAIERRVLDSVDLLTTVSEGLASRFLGAFGAHATVAYNVATHVQASVDDPLSVFRWSELHAALDEASLKFVYTGSLPAGYYDLRSFATAIRNAGDGLSGKQFVFVGACGELKLLVQQMAIPPGRIVFIDQVDIAMAQRIQRAADALIFLGFVASDNQGQVSIKLFEYMRQRKPILALNIKRGSDVDVILHKYCGRGCELVEPREIAQALSLPGRECLSKLPLPVDDSVDAELLRPYASTVEMVVRRLEAGA